MNLANSNSPTSLFSKLPSGQRGETLHARLPSATYRECQRIIEQRLVPAFETMGDLFRYAVAQTVAEILSGIDDTELTRDWALACSEARQAYLNNQTERVTKLAESFTSSLTQAQRYNQPDLFNEHLSALKSAILAVDNPTLKDRLLSVLSQFDPKAADIIPFRHSSDLKVVSP